MLKFAVGPESPGPQTPGISDTGVGDLLRGRQIHEAENNLRQALGGYLVAATLTFAYFYQAYG